MLRLTRILLAVADDLIAEFAGREFSSHRVAAGHVLGFDDYLHRVLLSYHQKSIPQLRLEVKHFFHLTSYQKQRILLL